ncbi:MAG: 2-oxoglutarate and iron-dependent oxygenase domain-containing protein [Myxococcota bacterium]
MSKESSYDESSVPVIEYADLGRDDPSVVQAIAKGFGEFGLVYVRGAPIAGAMLEALYASFLDVLARPRDEKASWGGRKVWYQRGWTPPNTEQAVAAGGQPDFKECFFAAPLPLDPEARRPWPELFAPNVWPAEAPAFREHLLAIGQALQRVGDALLRGCARALGVDSSTFATRTEGAAHVSRLLQYLPLDEAQIRAQPRVLWGEEHTDFNLLTLLPGGRFFREGSPVAPPADRGGLYLRTRPTAAHPQGRKVSGRPPAGCLVAQVGQQLEVLSDGRFLATPHGIVPPGVPGYARTSLAHFVHLRPDCLVAPLPDLRSPDSRYGPPVLAGTWAMATLATIGLAPPEAIARLGYTPPTT